MSGRSEVTELIGYFKRLEVERDDDMKRAGVKVYHKTFSHIFLYSLDSLSHGVYLRGWLPT